MSNIFTTKVRKWVYGILLAAFPVACFYFPALIPAAPLWLGLALAILNIQEDPSQTVTTYLDPGSTGDGR